MIEIIRVNEEHLFTKDDYIPHLNGEKSKRKGGWNFYFESGLLAQQTCYAWGVIAWYKKWNNEGLLIEELVTNLLETGMNTKEELRKWADNGALKELIKAEYGIIQNKQTWNAQGESILIYNYTLYNFDTTFL